MRESFEAGGFTVRDCEFIQINNADGENTDAYRGLNKLLSSAAGRYVILCHQDVILKHDGRSVLERRLEELSKIDPDWAVAGNAGGTVSGEFVIRISDKYGLDQKRGTFPARVCSVDENFFVVDNGKRIAFSGDLSGFHFYGTDICLVADMLGYSAYVIDFHLLHLGRGVMGPQFDACKQRFVTKWRRALRSRIITTTCVRVVLGSRGSSLLLSGSLRARAALRRWKRSLLKRIPLLKPVPRSI